jgi:hypothetical protein
MMEAIPSSETLVLTRVTSQKMAFFKSDVLRLLMVLCAHHLVGSALPGSHRRRKLEHAKLKDSACSY